jgi:hypothetical protein
MKPKGAGEQFAVWLAQNQPDVFQALAAQAHKAGQLHGITDWLTGVGTSLGAAVKSVGSFVSSPAGLSALTAASGVYLQTRAQKDALKLQTAQLRAGYAPQPVYTAGANGEVAYYIDPQSGTQYPLTPQLSSRLTPQKTLTDYAPWLIGGGFALAILFTLTRK